MQKPKLKKVLCTEVHASQCTCKKFLPEILISVFDMPLVCELFHIFGEEYIPIWPLCHTSSLEA